jgi:hypothetical protein
VKHPIQPGKILQIKELLKDRFPEAHLPQVVMGESAQLSGIGILDRLGIAGGCIAEAVSEVPGRGAGLLLGEVIREAAAQSRPVVLIDACDTFDPQSLPLTACRSLLWIRCQSVQNAVKAADLLLRDGNLTLILMDLERCPSVDLRRIPASSWHRLRMLTEKAGSLCLAFTPAKLIPRATTRILFEHPYLPETLEKPREFLRGMLEFRVAGKRSEEMNAIASVASS